MKYFKNASGEVFAYEEDGSQDQYIPSDQTPITVSEADALRKPKKTSAQVWEEIKAKRDLLQLEGGAPLDGHWLLSNDRAVTEYNSVIAAASAIGASETTVIRQGWRTMDGATVDMTPGLARQILASGFQQRCAIDDAAQAHRVAMEACADPSSYDFSSGWPVTFLG